jgi:hypothetical protein
LPCVKIVIADREHQYDSLLLSYFRCYVIFCFFFLFFFPPFA